VDEYSEVTPINYLSLARASKAAHTDTRCLYSLFIVQTTLEAEMIYESSAFVPIRAFPLIFTSQITFQFNSILFYSSARNTANEWERPLHLETGPIKITILTWHSALKTWRWVINSHQASLTKIVCMLIVISMVICRQHKKDFILRIFLRRFSWIRSLDLVQHIKLVLFLFVIPIRYIQNIPIF